MKNFIAIIFAIGLFFAQAIAPPNLIAQVCATYCPGQSATATITSIPGATYNWTITGPEVLAFTGQGTDNIAITSVGASVGQYVITVVVSPPGPLVCINDTSCVFDVTQPVGIAQFADICRDAGVTNLNTLATTLTPAGGTFTWTDPVTGNPVTSPNFDPGLFPSGTVNIQYAVNSAGCNISVNTTINIGDPPNLTPGIQMG